MVSYGNLEMRVSAVGDGGLSILALDVLTRGGGLPRNLVEKALLYPDISVFILNYTAREILAREGRLKGEFCEFELKDVLPYPLPDGNIVRGMNVYCSAVQGGSLVATYEEATGILLSKRLGFSWQNDFYYLDLHLLAPAPGMSTMKPNDYNVFILRTAALAIIIASVIAYIQREKYRVL